MDGATQQQRAAWCNNAPPKQRVLQQRPISVDSTSRGGPPVRGHQQRVGGAATGAQAWTAAPVRSLTPAGGVTLHPPARPATPFPSKKFLVSPLNRAQLIPSHLLAPGPREPGRFPQIHTTPRVREEPPPQKDTQKETVLHRSTTNHRADVKKAGSAHSDVVAGRPPTPATLNSSLRQNSAGGRGGFRYGRLFTPRFGSRFGSDADRASVGTNFTFSRESVGREYSRQSLYPIAGEFRKR